MGRPPRRSLGTRYKALDVTDLLAEELHCVEVRMIEGYASFTVPTTVNTDIDT